MGVNVQPGLPGRSLKLQQASSSKALTGRDETCQALTKLDGDKVHITMRPNRLLRVAGHCVIPALLLLPQAAPAAGGGLVETFNAICTDTFPSFQAMGDKVEALGGRLEPAAEPLYSRVPFVVPNSAKQGSTDQRHTNPLDDMGVDYAEGVVFDLPAAGCSVSRRGGVDEAAIAQLFNRFETATFLGDQKGTFTSGPYRAWLVRLSGGRAVLTIAEPQFAGKTMGVMFALVRLDETLLDQLTPRLRRDTPSRRPYGSKNFRGFDPVKDALRAPPAAVVDP